MSKYILKNGSRHSIIEIDSISKSLPMGTYTLNYDMMRGLVSLDKVDDFHLPKKIYGDQSIVERSIQVYKNKDRNFGILLYGLKGSGKSLCMRNLAIKLNQPIIIINQCPPPEGENDILKFLTDSTLGDCTILIDEFEKKFSTENDFPLTLLDGISSTHHFFILTANEFTINSNLQNRPGRIYYSIGYSGLEESVIRDVASDLLKDKSRIDELVDLCEDIPSISFDMLLSIIHDVNLFNDKKIRDTIRWFGFRQESSYVTVHQILNGIRLETPLVDSQYLSDTNHFTLWISGFKLFEGDEEHRDDRFEFHRNNFIKRTKNVYHITLLNNPYELYNGDKTQKAANKKKLANKGVQFEGNKAKVTFEISFHNNPPVKYLY